MLYIDELNRLLPKVELAVRELFKTAYLNQQHQSDILLVLENGFYNPEVEKINKRKPRHQQYSPFVVGPHFQHYAEQTQYNFYDSYRNIATTSESREDLFNKIRNTKKEQEYYIGTQMEMMIYLKFWESNRILERLYKLTQLCIGKEYDWYYEITKDDKRQLIIREEIRDPLKNVCPNFYQLIKDIYLSQIRNATAHSQFSIDGFHISFLNYDPLHHAPLRSIEIKEWEERFHLLVLLYNEFIGCQKVYNYIYKRKGRGKHFGVPLQLIQLDGSKKIEWYHYLRDIDRWQWYKSWKKGLKTFEII